ILSHCEANFLICRGDLFLLERLPRCYLPRNDNVTFIDVGVTLILNVFQDKGRAFRYNLLQMQKDFHCNP
ncbi:MAG TPA: hypothetical protein PKD13_10180, partial [Mariniflexile sp.]|nr:hypothetical protein [Mariniflexile sp.]